MSDFVPRTRGDLETLRGFGSSAADVGVFGDLIETALIYLARAERSEDASIRIARERQHARDEARWSRAYIQELRDWIGHEEEVFASTDDDDVEADTYDEGFREGSTRILAGMRAALDSVGGEPEEASFAIYHGDGSVTRPGRGESPVPEATDE